MTTISQFLHNSQDGYERTTRRLRCALIQTGLKFICILTFEYKTLADGVRSYSIIFDRQGGLFQQQLIKGFIWTSAAPEGLCSVRRSCLDCLHSICVGYTGTSIKCTSRIDGPPQLQDVFFPLDLGEVQFFVGEINSDARHASKSNQCVHVFYIPRQPSFPLGQPAHFAGRISSQPYIALQYPASSAALALSRRNIPPAKCCTFSACVGLSAGGDEEVAEDTDVGAP